MASETSMDSSKGVCFFGVADKFVGLKCDQREDERLLCFKWEARASATARRPTRRAGRPRNGSMFNAPE